MSAQLPNSKWFECSLFRVEPCEVLLIWIFLTVFIYQRTAQKGKLQLTDLVLIPLHTCVMVVLPKKNQLMMIISGDNTESVSLRFWLGVHGRRTCASHWTKHESRLWGKSGGLHCAMSEQWDLCTRDCGQSIGKGHVLQRRPLWSSRPTSGFCGHASNLICTCTKRLMHSQCNR